MNSSAERGMKPCKELWNCLKDREHVSESNWLNPFIAYRFKVNNQLTMCACCREQRNRHSVSMKWCPGWKVIGARREATENGGQEPKLKTEGRKPGMPKHQASRQRVEVAMEYRR